MKRSTESQYVGAQHSGGESVWVETYCLCGRWMSMNGNRRCIICNKRLVYDYARKLIVKEHEWVYQWVADPRGAVFISIRGERQMGDWKRLPVGTYRHDDKRVRYANETERAHAIFDWR